MWGKQKVADEEYYNMITFTQQIVSSVVVKVLTADHTNNTKAKYLL